MRESKTNTAFGEIGGSQSTGRPCAPPGRAQHQASPSRNVGPTAPSGRRARFLTKRGCGGANKVRGCTRRAFRLRSVPMVPSCSLICFSGPEATRPRGMSQTCVARQGKSWKWGWHVGDGRRLRCGTLERRGAQTARRVRRGDA